MDKFYKFKRLKSPWGDYSRILIHGMGAHLPRKDGLIQLERTGPYIPPISMTGAVIVTSPLRQMLEASGLTGTGFQPVIKQHIVQLDWRTWDLTAKKPQEYPQEGDPEGYILDRPHSPAVSEQMGDLWELIADEGMTLHRPEKPREESVNEFILAATSWRGADFFRVTGWGATICFTEKAKRWVEQQVRDHIGFVEVPAV